MLLPAAGDLLRMGGRRCWRLQLGRCSDAYLSVPGSLSIAERIEADWHVLPGRPWCRRVRGWSNRGMSTWVRGLLGMLSLGVLLIVAAPAPATTLLTDPGGLIPLPGLLRNASADRATMTITGVGTVSCTSTDFAVSFLANTAPTGSSVVGTLERQTLSSCTDTIPLIDFVSCARVATVTSNVLVRAVISGPGTVIPVLSYLRCGISGSSIGCYYSVGVGLGHVTNTPSTVNFPGTPLFKAAPAGTTDDLGAPCGTTGGTLSMRLTGLTQGTTGQTLTITT